MDRWHGLAGQHRNLFQLHTFFRALALVVAVFSLTWVGVLWWWQRVELGPQGADMLLYLGLLPLALLALLLGLRWVWRRKKALALPGGAGASAAAATTDTAPDGASAAARHAVLQIVQFQAHTVAGDQALDLLEASAAGKPTPQPDEQLRNEEGMPVLCARLADKGLDTEAMRVSLMALMTSLGSPSAGALPEQVLSDSLLRALAALEPALQAQRDGLLALHQARLNSLPDDASKAHSPLAQRPALPALRVLMGWPSHWTAGEQALARGWAERCLNDEQADLSTGYALTFTGLAGSGEELWLRADQVAHAAGSAPWLLILACDSDVDPARVSSLAASQRLYDATACPGGCMPGEAAAALLLAPDHWTPLLARDDLPVRIHRPALLRREKSVEAGGRVSHAELAQAVEQALMAARLTAADLGMVVCDADQHSQRNGELYGMAVQALAHLDPVEDMRLLGRVTGRTGVASALVVLAVAAEAVKSVKKPTLALTLADPHWRMAAVLKPQETRDDATT